MSLFNIEPLDCGYKGTLPLFTSYAQCIRVAMVGELLSNPPPPPEIPPAPPVPPVEPLDEHPPPPPPSP